jgi:EpsI family protein
MIGMRFPIKFLVMLALMLVAASVAWALRPTVLIADLRPKVDLESLIPKQFGDWRELQRSNAQIINPQQAEMLTKLYSQTLSRTYVNSKGDAIMLSIAYGANQGDAVQLHYPEVCYPAQGFQVQTNIKGTLVTEEGAFPVRRLTTTLGQRFEPVTYWTTIGDQVVQGGLNTKLAQMQYGFKGQIPDGLLFRVSSITRDAQAGHAIQEAFAVQLVSAVKPENRIRLIGDPAAGVARQ